MPRQVSVDGELVRKRWHATTLHNPPQQVIDVWRQSLGQRPTLVHTVGAVLELIPKVTNLTVLQGTPFGWVVSEESGVWSSSVLPRVNLKNDDPKHSMSRQRRQGMGEGLLTLSY